ncbi:hypothetical protein IFM89_002087 [Coptis chinensis]|uniref:Small auxin up regulated protein n=1 Tax=Coptis chinensis TaxID=261450 RepID=A0A835H3S7_9MAGN|nr:hypothetical protein IFM89_002087 [Coptis chinensis]
MSSTKVVGKILHLLKKPELKNHNGNLSTKKEVLPEVPEGYALIYVGEEHKSYMVQLQYLSCPMFQALLNQFEEQLRNIYLVHRINAHPEGPIVLPCSVELFESVLNLAMST